MLWGLMMSDLNESGFDTLFWATSFSLTQTSSASFIFFFSSRRRHTRWNCDWSSDVCSSDLELRRGGGLPRPVETDQHHDHGRRPAEIERGGLLAEQTHQLAVHELHEVLLGRQAA